MDVASRIVSLLEEEKTFCLATVVQSGGEGIRPGSKAIVLADGSMEGSLGSESLDQKLRDLSPTLFQDKKSGTINLEDSVRVFINILSSETKLLICGGGHIAIPLAQFARRMGFGVTVLDDRPDFAHPSRFPDCNVIAKDFAETLREIPLGPSTFVVVITRGHEHDVDCLLEILKKRSCLCGHDRQPTQGPDCIGSTGKGRDFPGAFGYCFHPHRDSHRGRITRRDCPVHRIRTGMCPS